MKPVITNVFILCLLASFGCEGGSVPSVPKAPEKAKDETLTPAPNPAAAPG